MTPLQIYSKKDYIPLVIPIVDGYENSVLVCFERIVIESEVKYKIVHFATLNDNPRKEILTAFLKYEFTTHYIINNFTDNDNKEQFIKEIQNIISIHNGIIND